MKKLNFGILLTSMLIANFTFGQSRNDIIINYENVQSGIVGKTLVNYQNGQALFGTAIPNVETKDEESSSEQRKKINTQFSFGISELLKGKNLKDIDVYAKNLKVTNITSDVEKLPTGSKIIMSGYKADSVVITMTKKKDLNLLKNISQPVIQKMELMNYSSCTKKIPSGMKRQPKKSFWNILIYWDLVIRMYLMLEKNYHQ